MVGTILPMVYRARTRMTALTLLTVHVGGYALASLTVGAALGLIGEASHLSRLPQAGKYCAMAILGVLLSLREMNLLKLPVPQSGRQVPSCWRALPSGLASFAYGAGLGVGFATRLSVSTYYLPMVWCLGTGNRPAAALVMSGFGLGRALPLVWLLKCPGVGACSDQITTARERFPAIKLINGLALATVAMVLLRLSWP